MPRSSVPTPDQGELPSWSDDARARAEERNWPDEDALRGQRTENSRRWLQVYGWLVVSFTLFFSGLFLTSLTAWAWHFLTPPAWAWLTADQLSKIQSIIFSGGLGAVLSTVVKRQLST